MTSMDCFPCCGTHKKQDKKSLKKDDSDRIGQSPVGSAADIARLRSGELHFAPVYLAPACDLIIIFSPGADICVRDLWLSSIAKAALARIRGRSGEES